MRTPQPQPSSSIRQFSSSTRRQPPSSSSYMRRPPSPSTSRQALSSSSSSTSRRPLSSNIASTAAALSSKGIDTPYSLRRLPLPRRLLQPRQSASYCQLASQMRVSCSQRILPSYRLTLQRRQFRIGFRIKRAGSRALSKPQRKGRGDRGHSRDYFILIKLIVQRRYLEAVFRAVFRDRARQGIAYVCLLGGGCAAALFVSMLVFF